MQDTRDLYGDAIAQTANAKADNHELRIRELERKVKILTDYLIQKEKQSPATTSNVTVNPQP